MYLLTSFDTDTNKRLGTPGSGNKWGRAQTSTQTSRDKWGQANEGDEGERAGMSANEWGTSANDQQRAQTKAKQRPNECYRVAGISTNGHTTERAQTSANAGHMKAKRANYRAGTNETRMREGR